MVNLLDLASLLDDISIKQVSLAPQILKTYNDAVPEVAKLSGDETGYAIQMLYASLPYVVQQQIANMSLLSVKQLKIVAADIARVRQSTEYLNKRADASAKAFVYITGTGAIVLALIGFISYAGERACRGDIESSTVFKSATAMLSTLLKSFTTTPPSPK